MGRASAWHESTLDIGRHLILPGLSLTLSLLGVQFLLVRYNVVGILGEEYMLVAHLAAHAGLAITGAVFIETLFQYPGMGRLIFEAVSARDYPVIQGVFLLVALAAPLLAPYDPHAFSGRPLERPNAAHPLGTNDAGQDILSELIHGARISLAIGDLATTLLSPRQVPAASHKPGWTARKI
jgi:hypothetical protein